MSREVRDKVLDVLDGVAAVRSAAARPCVRLRHGGPARAAARRDDAGHPSAARRAAPCSHDEPPPTPAPATGRLGPAEVLVPGGPFTMGTSTEPWALDNERPAHQVDVRAVPDRHRDGDVRRLPGRSSKRAGTTIRGGGRRRAGRTSGTAGSSRPGAWERSDGAWWRTRFGQHELVPAGRTGACTCASTRRRRSRPGRASGCRPRPSGRRRLAGIRPAGGLVATRGVTKTPGRSTRTSASGTCARLSAGAYPGRRVAARRPAADRRRLGVDQQRLPAVPGLRRVPVCRVLAGVLRLGLQGAARRVVRHRRRGLSRDVPQLGLPDPPSDLLRLPVCSRRAGRRDRLTRRCVDTSAISVRP